ncbi:hypothetical protein F5879DRAFT_918123 [Lentinula edodes]|nr:hypothetical protein F5879DRAFT_918123 [Lentinula edodes]
MVTKYFISAAVVIRKGTEYYARKSFLRFSIKFPIEEFRKFKDSKGGDLLLPTIAQRAIEYHLVKFTFGFGDDITPYQGSLLRDFAATVLEAEATKIRHCPFPEKNVIFEKIPVWEHVRGGRSYTDRRQQNYVRRCTKGSSNWVVDNDYVDGVQGEATWTCLLREDYFEVYEFEEYLESLDTSFVPLLALKWWPAAVIQISLLCPPLSRIYLLPKQNLVDGIYLLSLVPEA